MYLRAMQYTHYLLKLQANSIKIIVDESILSLLFLVVLVSELSKSVIITFLVFIHIVSQYLRLTKILFWIA